MSSYFIQHYQPQFNHTWSSILLNHGRTELLMPVTGHEETPKAIPKTQKQPPAMIKRYLAEVSWSWLEAEKKMCYDCVMSFFVLRALDFLVVGCGWNLVALLCLLVTSCGGKHGFYAWEPTMIEETHNHANVVLSSPLHLKRHRNIMNYATCANLNAGLCWYQKLNQGTSRRIHSLLTVMCCSHWLLRR